MGLFKQPKELQYNQRSFREADKKNNKSTEGRRDSFSNLFLDFGLMGQRQGKTLTTLGEICRYDLFSPGISSRHLPRTVAANP